MIACSLTFPTIFEYSFDYEKYWCFDSNKTIKRMDFWSARVHIMLPSTYILQMLKKIKVDTCLKSFFPFFQYMKNNRKNNNNTHIVPVEIDTGSTCPMLKFPSISARNFGTNNIKWNETYLWCDEMMSTWPLSKLKVCAYLCVAKKLYCVIDTR